MAGRGSLTPNRRKNIYIFFAIYPVYTCITVFCTPRPWGISLRFGCFVNVAISFFSNSLPRLGRELLNSRTFQGGRNGAPCVIIVCVCVFFFCSSGSMHNGLQRRSRMKKSWH